MTFHGILLMMILGMSGAADIDSASPVTFPGPDGKPALLCPSAVSESLSLAPLISQFAKHGVQLTCFDPYGGQSFKWVIVKGASMGSRSLEF